MAAATNSRRAVALLATLTAINFLNFIDRQVLFAVFPAVKQDLGLSDGQLGLAASAFIVVYMIVTPVAGLLGDRVRRLPIVGVSVALWSAATVIGGFAMTFRQLLFSRTLVGVGEASYAPLSSAMIADSFPAERRGSSLAIFNVAVPVGSACGYILGGLIAERFGWRAAFTIVGLPGFALAALVLLLPEPERGGADSPAAIEVKLAGDARGLLVNVVYLVATAAMAVLTFVLGGLAAWMPTFLVRVHGLSLGSASIAFGLMTAATGVAGTALGGWIGDWALRRHPSGHLWISAAGLLLAVPASWLAIGSDQPVVFWSATAVAEILVFLNTGPLNAVIVGVAAPRLRATAVALNILCIHLFGDALSPWIIGALSDEIGLRAALGVVPPLLLASGVLCLAAGRFIPRRR
jgi:MFS transporter, Spinster family, sphingosine-1-phosphate transporter